MAQGKWRFPASGSAVARGLSTGDSETFKGRPYQAFAREILQNSIDARKDFNNPVRVEFKSFSISISDIPGTEDLKNAFRRCKEYWFYKEDHVKTYTYMEKILNNSSIQCLRISDFNTTGLIGIESNNNQGNKFFALTKGSGVSEKDKEVAGGSKGLGKNAAISMSEIRTVFYSTHTCESLDKSPVAHKGSFGFADLVSGYVKDDIENEKRDYTQGPGFFGIDDYNSPSNELFNIDPSYNKRDMEFGTDVFVLGFEGEKNWENEVVNTILDSFLVAIYYGELEIVLNDRIITKDTLKTIIEDGTTIYKKNYSNFITQYRMLSGDKSVSVYDIETEYGNCEMYILPLEAEEESLATHKCEMVRYPYMKIKSIELGANFRVSALCIIGENVLGKELRDIENAEHTDWQTKRIKDKNKRKEIESVLAELKEELRNAVIDCLQMDEMETIDPNGAGEFIPDIDPGANKSKDPKNLTPSEKVDVISIKENSVTEKNANNPDANGNGLEPFIGGQNDEEEGEVVHPEGHNGGGGGEVHPGSGNSGETEGEEELLRKTQLSGVKYKVISTDKTNGSIRVIFVAPIDYENCFLQVRLLDDVNSSSLVKIEKMEYKGQIIGGEDEDGYGPFSIKRNDKIILDVKTSKKGFFASEVKVICK